MNTTLNRSRFLQDTVATAGPQQILTMLYDRLVLDINRAEIALRRGDRRQATDLLGHAQEIVASLSSTLDVEVWEGGKSLMELYMYLLRELVGVSIDGDADRAAACAAIVTPLRDAWHEAAASLSAAAPVVPTQRHASVFGEPAALGGDLGVG